MPSGYPPLLGSLGGRLAPATRACWLVAVSTLVVAAPGAAQQPTPQVIGPVQPVLSVAVSTLPAAPRPGSASGGAPRRRPPLPADFQDAPQGPDGALQAAPGTGRPPDPGLNFEGIPFTGSVPPDPIGDVGPNHYVQMVNTEFAVYDKTGTPLTSPVLINSLWSGLSGECATTNGGDPVVVYDELADRWLLSQFASPASGNHLCLAVSQTSDPTGTYFLYQFTVPVFPDYFKLGVWPDAYYLGANGGTPRAFDRASMLAGAPATSIGFTTFPDPVSVHSMMLPSELDGAAPPAGAPNYFYRFVDGDLFGGVDRLEVFEFHVDFAVPANSTFTGPTSLPTAAFDTLCGFSFNCVPQPGTTQRLDSITEWPMWRFQYRNFGTHETLMANHTVDVSGGADRAGVRWYELRKTGGGPWTIFQQGTFGPNDGLHRWMGSVAMDQSGNIAVGYSVSSSAAVSPSLRYTGRLATDPAGTLQTEVTLVDGAGSQVGSNRWGDYSAMSVDPADGCTFWFTGEHYQTTSAGWQTRVGTIRFPGCGSIPQSNIDQPVHGASVSQPFDVVGWAIDQGAASGTGVDMVEGFATPTGGGAEVSLGPATYGLSRPDVGAAFGAQFTNSGFSLSASGLAPGTYDLLVRARSTVSSQLFDSATVGISTGVSSIALSPTTVSFGAVHDAGELTVATSPRRVTVTQSGPGTVDWSASSADPWINVTSASGSGSGSFEVEVVADASLPASGQVTGEVTVQSSDAGAGAQARPPHPASPPLTVDITLALFAPGTSTGPFGVVDTPLDGIVGVSGSLGITGWALDDVEVTGVQIWRDPVGGETPGSLIFVGDAVFIDGARPDVAAANPATPLSSRAGWGFLVLTNMLPNQGNGTYTFHVFADDAEGNSVLLGTRTITADNASATVPFGAIDTPAQGATISGSAFLNFGWALTPQPKIVPIDGSTVTVFIDGVSQGTVDYNHERSDIETLFPNFQNTLGANGGVGFATIDTTLFADGLHTIEWGVVDNEGAASGIGSRFFSILNQGGSQTAAAPPPPGPRFGARAAPARHPIWLRRGAAVDAPLDTLYPDPSGSYAVHVAARERIELVLSPPTPAAARDRPHRGALLTAEGPARLPIGSTLDAAAGRFSWQPAAGFLGGYRLAFVTADHELVRVLVVLSPQHADQVGPRRPPSVVRVPRRTEAGGTPD